MPEEIEQLDAAYRASEVRLLEGLVGDIRLGCEGEILCPNPAIFAAICRTPSCRHLYLWCGAHLHVKATLAAVMGGAHCSSCGHGSPTFRDVVDIVPVHLREGRVA